MNPQHGLALVDMIEGTGQRIDLLRARVDALDVYLTVAVAALFFLSFGCLALALRVGMLAAQVDRLEAAAHPKPPSSAWPFDGTSPEPAAFVSCDRRPPGGGSPCGRRAGHTGPHGVVSAAGIILAPWNEPTSHPAAGEGS